MNTDPKLKQRHQEIQRFRIKQQKSMIDSFINEGVIRETIDSNEVKSLITSSWIITNYWLSFLESSGEEISEESIEEGIQLIMTVIKPYINNGGGLNETGNE